MGGCLILESLVLLKWCEKNGYGPLGITGLSMGGHMASLAASNYPKPLVLVPCLSWSTASSVFTEGVMSHSINWDMLETQYYADGNYREKLSKMVTIVDDAFVAGKHFIQNFRESMKELKEDIKDTSKMIMDIDKQVHLSVVNETNTSYAKKQFLEINGRSNKLNLSMELLDKLLAGEKCELTASEINELNEKIKVALRRLRSENKFNQKVLEEKANLTVNNNVINEQSALVPALQSDTSSSDSSTILSSAFNFSYTRLMSLLSPQSKDNNKINNTQKQPDVPVREKFTIGKTNWWENEATQFMRGMMVSF